MEYKAYQTIYMPVSQFIFAIGYLTFRESLTGFKFIYILFDLGVILLLHRLLVEEKRDPLQVIWYAWCPLPITEIALAGHQDVVGVFLMLLAFVLVLRKKTVLWGAVALVAAGLTKGFALLLIPLFVRKFGKPFAMVAAVTLIYLSLPLLVYIKQFDHGMNQYLVTVNVNSGLFHGVAEILSTILRYPMITTKYIFDAIILIAIYWSCRTVPVTSLELIRRSFVVLAVLLLSVPTMFPWYLLWLLPLLPLLGRTPSWAFIVLSGLEVLLYTYYIAMMPLWWIPIAEYVPFYLILVWEYRRWVSRSGSTHGYHLIEDALRPLACNAIRLFSPKTRERG